jgi:hypothetical protein
MDQMAAIYALSCQFRAHLHLIYPRAFILGSHRRYLVGLATKLRGPWLTFMCKASVTEVSRHYA